MAAIGVLQRPTIFYVWIQDFSTGDQTFGRKVGEY
jgi:hypothetical protein